MSNPLIRQQGVCGVTRFWWRDALPCWDTEVRPGRELVRVLDFFLLLSIKIHLKKKKHHSGRTTHAAKLIRVGNTTVAIPTVNLC